MSGKEDVDVDTLLKVLKATHRGGKPPAEVTKSNLWLPLGIAILPIMITLGGVIYNTGVQTEELSSGIEQGKLELQVEFTHELAEYKDSVNDSTDKLQAQLMKVVQENYNLKLIVEKLDEHVDDLEDDNKDIKKLAHENYRVLQYLKSKSDLNITPSQ